MPEWTETAVVFLVGIVLYSLVSLGSAVSFAWTSWWRDAKCTAKLLRCCDGGKRMSALAAAAKLPRRATLARRVRPVFRGFLQLFLAARITWCVVHFVGHLQLIPALSDSSRSEATFILNRVAFVLFFSSFCLVVFDRAEQFHKSYVDTKSFLPQMGWSFVAVNLMVYVLQIIMLVVYVVESNGTEKREGDVLYEANILVDVGLTAAVALGFMGYGLLLWSRARRSAMDPAALNPEQAREAQGELAKMLIITVAISICFLARVFFLSYRLLTGKFLPIPLFYTGGYFLPEIVPSALQVYLSEATEERQQESETYFRDLYGAGDDDETGSASGTRPTSAGHSSFTSGGATNSSRQEHRRFTTTGAPGGRASGASGATTAATGGGGESPPLSPSASLPGTAFDENSRLLSLSGGDDADGDDGDYYYGGGDAGGVHHNDGGTLGLPDGAGPDVALDIDAGSSFGRGGGGVYYQGASGDEGGDGVGPAALVGLSDSAGSSSDGYSTFA